MSDKKWISDGNIYRYDSIPSVDKVLPVGIYELGCDVMGFFVQRVADKFILPDKVYGNERVLIDRVKKSFLEFNKNFGILLKGLKGTGKTITAKQISNELSLPVILVNHHYGNMGSFINSIQQDIIMMFDEFEKTYQFNSWSEDEENENDKAAGIGNLLTLMDGVFTSKYKRLFLLTTNKEYMPDAIMSRPSRVRYIKNFSDLDYEGIVEILEDTVSNKDLIPQLLELMSDLKIITIDIVKAIGEEANLYNTADKEFFSIFNILREESYNDIFRVGDNGSETIIKENVKIDPSSFYQGYGINFGEGYAVITGLKDYNDPFTVTIHITKVDEKGKSVSIPETRTYVVKKHKSIHQAFESTYLV